MSHYLFATVPDEDAVRALDYFLPSNRVTWDQQIPLQEDTIKPPFSVPYDPQLDFRWQSSPRKSAATKEEVAAALRVGDERLKVEFANSQFFDINNTSNPRAREFMLWKIGKAIQGFSQRYPEMLPPRYLIDDAGIPTHSWRALILRELGYSELFALIDFDRPWNAPANANVAAAVPLVYWLNSELKSGETNVQTLYSAWSPITNHRPTSVTNSVHSRSIKHVAMVAETTLDHATAWLRPNDFPLLSMERVGDALQVRNDGFIAATLSGPERLPSDSDRLSIRQKFEFGE